MRAVTASLALSTYAALVVCAEVMTNIVYVSDRLDNDRSATSSAPDWGTIAPTAGSSSMQSQRSSGVHAAPCSSLTTEPSTGAAPVRGPIGYMAVVDRWRATMGLEALRNNATLEANAMDTVVSSNGQMVHKLGPGTFGQVLAPGSIGDFEHVFVGGWLCEIPSLPGLQGVCATQSDGWAYNGQTGHAKILVSEEYSDIGCALYAGIWCCDLA